jgi:hypothetical protein
MSRCIRGSALVLGFILAGPAAAQNQSAAGYAGAAELPTFELMGFPITPVQVQVVGPNHVQEWSPAPNFTLGGMPASPHQMAVLTPRSSSGPRKVVGWR